MHHIKTKDHSWLFTAADISKVFELIAVLKADRIEFIHWFED